MGREEAAFGHGCEKSPCHSDKVFDELSAEVDATAHMYSMGMEKKEIADAKCRSIHTINAQLELAFDALGVSNGRELTMVFFERLTNMKLGELMGKKESKSFLYIKGILKKRAIIIKRT